MEMTRPMVQGLRTSPEERTLNINEMVSNSMTAQWIYHVTLG